MSGAAGDRTGVDGACISTGGSCATAGAGATGDGSSALPAAGDLDRLRTYCFVAGSHTDPAGGLPLGFACPFSFGRAVRVMFWLEAFGTITAAAPPPAVSVGARGISVPVAAGAPGISVPCSPCSPAVAPSPGASGACSGGGSSWSSW